MTIVSRTCDNKEHPTGRTASYVIATSDADFWSEKAQSDEVLTGVADNVIINAALTANAGGSVAIIGTNGTVTLATGLTIPSNTEFYGKGNITINGTGAGTFYRLITNTDIVGGNTNIKIHDLILDANWAAGVRAAQGGVLTLVNVNGAEITNVTAKNGYNHNFELIKCLNVDVIRCTSIDPKGDDGFSVSDGNSYGGTPGASTSRYIRFIDCNASGTLDSASSGFEVDDGPYYVSFTGCKVTGNTAGAGFLVHVHSDGQIGPKWISYDDCLVNTSYHGFSFTTDGATNDSLPVSHITITGCRVLGLTNVLSQSVKITSIADLSIMGNTLRDGYIGISQSAGAAASSDIRINGNNLYGNTCSQVGINVYDGSYDIKIIGNLVEEFGQSGIQVYAGAVGVHDILIQANTCKNNGTTSAGYAGIRLISNPAGSLMTSVSVLNNTCYDDQTPQTQSYGMTLYAAQFADWSDVLIKDNDIKGNLTAPVSYGSAATAFIAKFVGNTGYIAPGEVRTKSGSLVPTGTCTLTTVTGTFTESPAALKPGINTLHCTADGTANVVMPAGSTAVVASVGGGATVADSPKSCPASATTLITVTAGGTNEFTVTVTCIAAAVACPEAQNCLVDYVLVDIATPGGTATSVLQVGMANDAVGTGLGSEVFTGLDLNAAAINDSRVAGDTGAMTKPIPWNATGADSYMIFKINTEIADALVGTYTIVYHGR